MMKKLIKNICQAITGLFIVKKHEYLSSEWIKENEKEIMEMVYGNGVKTSSTYYPQVRNTNRPNWHNKLNRGVVKNTLKFKDNGR